MKKVLQLITVQLFFLLIIPKIANADFTLQLATYPLKSMAERYVQKLKTLGYEAFIHTQERQISNGGVWYKVRIGPFSSKQSALKEKTEMLSKGFHDDIILVENPYADIETTEQADDHSKNIMDNHNGNDSSIMLDNATSYESNQAYNVPNSQIEFKQETFIDENKSPQFLVASVDSQHPEEKSRPDKNVKEDSFSEKDSQTSADIDLLNSLSTSTLQEKNKRKVSLEWIPNTEPELAGYKIYYDTDPDEPYAPDISDRADEGPSPIVVNKAVNSITLHGLNNDKDYYFRISAFNSRGIESKISDTIRSSHVDASSIKGTADDFQRSQETRQILEKYQAEKGLNPDSKDEQAIRDESENNIPLSNYTVEKKPPFSLEEPPDTTILSAGDTLYIEIPGQPQMSQNYDIGPDGNLYVLALGKITAHGLRLSDLNRVLSIKGRKYMGKGEQPLIRIVDIKRYVNILGGVRYAGWYRVSPWSSVDDLINIAGGLLSPESASRIKLLRPTQDGIKTIDLKKEFTLETNDVLDIPFPKEYHKKIDSGDLLFVSIPSKIAQTNRRSDTESADFIRELKQNQIEVDRNGYLYIPTIGHLYVRGLTTEEIERLVESKLPKYLARAEKVLVNIVEKRHYVQVFGHVRNPGRYNIQESGTVQEALSAAGSPIDGAIMSDIAIQRMLPDGLHKIKVNIYQYTITGDERLLTPLHEDDTLFVPISSNFGNVKRTLDAWEPPTERLEEDVKAKVRIFGAVRNVGIYEPHEDMDLIDLLVLASGQTDDADLSKVLIIRNNKIELSFNMEEWLEKFAETDYNPVPKLYDGDTIYVTYIKKKTFEPKEDELYYALGEVRKQGQYKLYDRMTVLQALALAGGLNDFADSEHILVIRWVEGKQENIPFNYIKAIEGKLPETNIYVQARDVIWVP